MRKLLLAIDTAGSRCAVAVYDMASGAVLSQADPEIGRGHAELLMGLIAEVMETAAAGYADIGKIAVVVGPGSFTGLRVGVAAAKGLALALAIPAVGVTTLEAIAEPHWPEGPPVLAVIDAKRGELYAALWGRRGEVLRTAEALRPEKLGAFVAEAGGVPVLAVGTGAAIAAQALGPSRVAGAIPSAVSPIVSVARLGTARHPKEQVKPLYLRGADAKPQGPSGISHVTL